MKYTHKLLLLSFSIVFASITSCSQKKEYQAENNSEAVQPTVQLEKETITNEPSPSSVTFNEHVQPILSEYCYHCHGPDSSSREPKKDPFRLDREDFAFLERDGTPMIIPGKPEESELIRLIKSHDKDEVMPPANGHKHMKPHHIAIIEQWVKQGAEYQEHWAFIPPTKPEFPNSDKSNWGNNGIDYFVAQQLAKHQLEPNKEQDAVLKKPAESE